MMRNIYIGDRGTLVQYLQLALNRAGISVAIDGEFGRETCEGLRTFLGESVGCYVDNAIWNRLEPYLKGYVTYSVVQGDTLYRLLLYTNITTSQSSCFFRWHIFNFW